VVRGYALDSCRSCGVLHVEHRPSPEELKSIYDQLFEEGEYEAHRREFELLKSGRSVPNFDRQRLLRRAGSVVSGRSLVEIGGGTGTFGLDAKRRGWDYVNYDISEIAVGFCTELGLDARIFSPASPPPLERGSADLVVMWEVLEHVWDVKGYLEVIRASLRPSGLLLLSTPNYGAPVFRERDNWGLLSSPPIHLTFFTRPTLERTLLAGGFGYAKVFSKRLWRPRWTSLASWSRSLRFLLRPEASEGLYAIAGVEPRS
jgi:SAM-dependent methyltransferase